jgi:hypothetical protein
MGIQGVTRAVPPDELMMGIMSCGGVQEYYNSCIEMERQERTRLSASAQAIGLQVSSPFPANTQEVIETTITGVARKRMTIVPALIDAGLVTPLPNWWGIPALRRRRSGGDQGRAHRTMSPDSRGERFVLSEGSNAWPIFCTWSNFSFEIRELAYAQRNGSPLDTAHIEQAAYLNNEAVEDQAINGATDEQGNTLTIDGLTAPGLLSSATTFSYSTWTGLTGAQIVDSVLGAIEAMRLTYPGLPLQLFVPGNYSKILNTKYTTAYSTGTIRMALEELGPYGGSNLKVTVSDTIPNNRVILAVMDKSVMDVVVGQTNVPVSWKDGPGFNTHWVVLSCMIFRMFPNADGLVGINVGNLA